MNPINSKAAPKLCSKKKISADTSSLLLNGHIIQTRWVTNETAPSTGLLRLTQEGGMRKGKEHLSYDKRMENTDVETKMLAGIGSGLGVSAAVAATHAEMKTMRQ